MPASRVLPERGRPAMKWMPLSMRSPNDKAVRQAISRAVRQGKQDGPRRAQASVTRHGCEVTDLSRPFSETPPPFPHQLHSDADYQKLPTGVGMIYTFENAAMRQIRNRSRRQILSILPWGRRS